MQSGLGTMRGRVRVTEDPGGVKGLIRAQARSQSLRCKIVQLKCLKGNLDADLMIMYESI